MGAASGCPLIVHVDHLVCLYETYGSRSDVLLQACCNRIAERKANHSGGHGRIHFRVVLHSICTHRSVCWSSCGGRYTVESLAAPPRLLCVLSAWEKAQDCRRRASVRVT